MADTEDTEDTEAPLPKNAFADFIVDETAGMSSRYVAILLYAAENYPRAFIPRNLIFKLANKRAALPPPRGREVQTMSGPMGRAKRILAEEPYRRALISQSNGYRLTVDDAEWLLYAVPPARRRLDSATQNALRVDALGDVAKVPATPELDPMKRDYKKFSSSVLSRLRSPEFLASLALPPAKEEEKKTAPLRPRRVIGSDSA